MILISRLGLGLSAALSAVLACSSGGGVNGGAPRGGDGGGASGATAGGSGGAAGVNGSAGNPVVVVPGGSGGAAGDGASCAGEVHEAERVPLDIYIMLDRSDSMLDATPSGGTKWDAVVSAITRFGADPASEGLGVGLQYFPLRRAGVPAQCRMDAECGAAGGACIKTCRDVVSAGQPILCTEHSHCGSGANCVPFGRCSGNNAVCWNVGASCGGGGGSCAAASSTCATEFSCEADDYSEPALAVAELPGAGAALVASLDAQAPAGSTPTGVALRGAVAAARAHSAANDGRHTVVLLATDGLPSDCAPIETTAIAEIAAEGASGTPAVLTFVIGVFGDANEAQESRPVMNAIAAAGDTDSAIVVGMGSDVAAEFLGALNQIRTLALPCDFELPPAPAGRTLDYGQVNVEVTLDDAAPGALGYVPAEGDCGGDGGWYYDVDPATGGVPTTIRVCPATCAEFRAQPSASVDVRVGCATVVRPPPR